MNWIKIRKANLITFSATAFFASDLLGIGCSNRIVPFTAELIGRTNSALNKSTPFTLLW